MTPAQPSQPEDCTSFEDVLKSYDYALPSSCIATAPVSPRDRAKLLVYNRKTHTITDDVFSALGKHLPPYSVLVLNETKVIPARFRVTVRHRRNIPLLFLGIREGYIRVLAPRTIARGTKLLWEQGHSLHVHSREGREALLAPSFTATDMVQLLERFGETPLPPYMKESPLHEAERRIEYQTVFAQTPGSVAAPTAGLHFTPALMHALERAGHTFAKVLLHVNLGTFAPLEEHQWRAKKLHSEWFSIPEETLSFLTTAKQAGRSIVAVGTTVVRTLESAQESGVLERQSGDTDLFITESSPVRFVDHLITNFHVPRSSLMMLTSAFTGRKKLLELYEHAKQEHYRFFSFGDAMLVL
jgi:S-adenosylmethionine:tRNA ribosyltransferase-isomerase